MAVGRQFSQQIGYILLVVVAAVVIVGSADHLIKSRTEERSAEILGTLLGGISSLVDRWHDNQLKIVSEIARLPSLQSIVSNVISAEENGTDIDHAPLIEQVEDRALRPLRQYGYLDFAVYDLAGGVILQSPSFPTSLISERPILKTVKSDAPGLKRLGNLERRDLSHHFLAVAPIADSQGLRLGSLVLRVDPTRNFEILLGDEQFMMRGNIYVFDKARRVLFRGISGEDDHHLVIEEEEFQQYFSTPGKLSVFSEQELASGQIVYTRWLWKRDLDLGLIIELDKYHIYNLYKFVHYLLYGVATLAVVLFCALLLNINRGRNRILEGQLRMQAIVNSASESILLTDENGIIEHANPATEGLFGYPLSDIEGGNVNFLIPDFHTGLNGHSNSDAAAEEKDVEGVRADGSRFPIHLRVSEISLNSGLHYAGIVRDISQEQAGQRLKDREHQFLLSVLDNLTAHIAVLDSDGEITFVNKSWKRFAELNGGAPSTVGKGANYLQYVDRASENGCKPAAEVGEKLQDVLSGRLENYTHEYECHGPDEQRWFEMIATRLQFEGETSAIVFHLNITDLKLAEAELIQAREHAEAASRTKSTFLATMSHEIRTPLNGVLGTINLIEHTELDPNQRDLISTAQHSASLLQTIIDDILDFSKIESEHLKLEHEPLTWESLVETTADALLPLAQSKNLEFLIDCDPTLEPVNGDQVRLRQIIFNLAGNAIKFTNSSADSVGRVMISVKREADCDGKQRLSLTVSDNGIGMSAEVQNQLFQPFVQGEQDTTRRFGGTGLGLVIVKRLLEMMDGEISVNSLDKVGTTFTVDIAQELAPHALDQIGESDDQLCLDGLSVIVVDAHAEAAQIIYRYLKHAGASVQKLSRDKLLSELQRLPATGSRPRVVIETEGHISGNRIIPENLGSLPSGQHLRFLMVERGKRRSARWTEDNTMVIDLNAMHRKAVLEALCTLTTSDRLSHDREFISKTRHKPTAPEAASTDLGQANIRILLAEDNSINQKVIAQQLALLGCTPDIADDGLQALSMLETNDYDMLMTDCHMPQMDGYELARTIRQRERDGIRLPIIAITADALIGTRTKCLAAGMDDCLSKPLAVEALKQTLEEWLADKIQNGNPVVDPDALNELLGTADPEEKLSLYREFMESMFRASKDIELAYKQGDLQAVGEIAHRIKSSARTIGANSLADCYAALERSGREGDFAHTENHMYQLPALMQAIETWVAEFQSEHG